MVEQKTTVAQGSGVGSIWNKGNWHWEEKNYNEFAKQWLTENWCTIVHKTTEAEISIYEVKELKGAASVTIRKQKQLFMFEFEAELYFRARSTVPGDDRTSVQGKIKIHEFNQEDDELQTEVTAEKPGKWADNVKRAMRNEVTEKLFETTMKLSKAMKEKDVDEEKLARAKAEEKAATVAYKQAEESSGAEKLAIFEAKKKAEEEMKRKEAAKPVPIQVTQRPQAVQGTGSVWNTNSYHWEEKSVAKWSEETLRKILSTFTNTYNDATLKVTEVKELKGESGVSVRKGKKCVFYDYSMLLKWECTIADKLATGVVATCSGTYELPEVSNEDEADEWEVRTQYLEDKDKLQLCLDQMIRNFAPTALKKVIQAEFVEELKKK